MACQLVVTTGRPHTSGRVDASLLPAERRGEAWQPLLLLLLLLRTDLLTEAARNAPGAANCRLAIPKRSIATMV